MIFSRLLLFFIIIWSWKYSEIGFFTKFNNLSSLQRKYINFSIGKYIHNRLSKFIWIKSSLERSSDWMYIWYLKFIMLNDIKVMTSFKPALIILFKFINNLLFNNIINQLYNLRDRYNISFNKLVEKLINS